MVIALRGLEIASLKAGEAIRMVGSKDALQAVIAGIQIANGNTGGFVCKWRAGQNKTANTYIIEISI
jgi:hypothetical protein